MTTAKTKTSDDGQAAAASYENGTVRDEANINYTVVTEGAPPEVDPPEDDAASKPAAD
jgi:hypothetical protein